MNIVKYPIYEDDSYYFIIHENDILRQVDNDYFRLKRKAFKDKNTSKHTFEAFFDKPSFTGIENQDDLRGTIYTNSAVYKNQLPMHEIIRMVEDNKDISRRCVITIADTLRDYLDDTINTSCLNIIHYHKNIVKLFFRASDVENELLIDLLLIKEFFIDPVYKHEENPEIHVIASTAQNVHDISQIPKLLINY